MLLSTEKQKQEFEKGFYGGTTINLSQEQLIHLLNGGTVATDISCEYAIFIELDEEILSKLVVK